MQNNIATIFTIQRYRLLSKQARKRMILSRAGISMALNEMRIGFAQCVTRILVAH